LKRIYEKNYPIEGASDHGVSEAIYLRDPDGNGVELYTDREARRMADRFGRTFTDDN
jgi:catechol 2,3-dioxygenase